MRLAIAFLFVVSWTPPVFGYDYASACARPFRTKRGHNHQEDLPCDLTKQTYCTTPGRNYPWHAIRRFVRENQGLMRRMYGEERHIAVIKAELENFIDDEDYKDQKKTSDFAEDILKTKMLYSKQKESRAMKDKPYFRPIQTSNKKVDNETFNLRVQPLENQKHFDIRNNSKGSKNKTEVTNNETIDDKDDKGISYKTKLESIANIEINNLEPDVITLEAVIKQSIETNGVFSKFTNNEGKSESVSNKNDTSKEAATTESTGDETTIEQFEDTTTEANKDGWKPITADTSTLPPTLLFSEHDKNKIDRIDTASSTKMNDKKEEVHQKPEKVQNQETMRPSVIKLRGANACESKEEMAAPFWANSTRGEVLALLNMYPFEQYIHLETCVHERKQMYCREGCRCEQQYRLHRLLAYDPRNECRGIFADWFKFPACCVCKCYDVPLEFRARSPRILHPKYDEDVKRVIYEDVARDWYTLSTYEDEDDLI